MNARHTKILNLVSARKKIAVGELSELLNVSEVTMRKDLSLLEKNNLLRRSHGFAAMMETDDVGSRLAFNYEMKQIIAQKTLETIKDGETIMIESGSCCALLADEIVTNRRDVTIITNSVFIASFIRKKIGAHIILLGGDFQNESQVMVGPLVKKYVQNFFVDKFFCGTDGFNDFGVLLIIGFGFARDLVKTVKTAFFKKLDKLKLGARKLRLYSVGFSRYRNGHIGIGAGEQKKIVLEEY